VEVDTLFQAASLSKPVSAVVAAAAHEAGLLDLDADVFDLLVSWRHPPMPFEGPVTLRMLLAHRAGTNVPGFPGYSLDEPLPSLATILDGVRDKNEPIRVYSQPGADRVYSGGGFVMAQLAVEDHTGMTWEDLADDLVFGPLGLPLSTYRLLTHEDRDRVAVGYRIDGSEVAGGGWHQYPETAPASLWTTPIEYAGFVIDVMRSYADGTGVVLDRETARRLLDPGFAVGFGVDGGSESISIGHEGANEGYRCRFRAIPDTGDGVVVMTNADGGLDLAEAVVDVVGDELGMPGPPWSTPLWAGVLMVLGAAGLVAAGVAWIVARRQARMP
jgi:CubicO group peptidase (beta-lactamase class C family)